MGFEYKDNYEVQDLVEIVRMLRSENGCPWDKVQTHQSIRADLIEEAYETADAIDNDSSVDMCEELGDLLLQVVFHSVIAEETDEFNLSKVADGICKKLILRHPHVFSTVKADTPEQVLENWDKIKMQEKNQVDLTDTLKSVPKAFPSLMRAQKLQKRAAKAGKASCDSADAMNDLVKSFNDFQNEKNAENLGDMLLSVTKVAHSCGINAEQELASSCDRFIERFEQEERGNVKKD